MQNILQTINISKTHFDKILVKAGKLDSEIKELEEWLWTNESNESISNKDLDKMELKIKKMKDKRSYCYSMYSFVSLIDKLCKRNKDQQIDVTKIFITENTYNKMKDHDRKLLHIIYNNILPNKKIEQELGMIHLFSGFSIVTVTTLKPPNFSDLRFQGISIEAEDDKIYICEGFLRNIS